MKILYVTNMYPTVDNPYYGIFVKEQIDSIKNLNNSKDEIDTKTIFINGKKSVFQYLLSVFTINYHLCFNKYDIIHIHYGLSGLFLLFSFFLKTPVIVTFHGGDIQKEQKKSIQNFISRLVASKVSLCIVLNNNMESIVKKICKKTLTIPCGIDTNIFIDNQALNPIQNYTIVFPGNSNRLVKNFPLFKDVIDIVSEKMNCQIDVIEIKNMTRQEVSSSLNRADCLLMTSISEGSPQVIKEAMACNLPIISTDVGDVANLLKNVDYCFISESNSSEHLVKLVVKVLSNKKRSSNGRIKIFEMGLDSLSVAKSIYSAYLKLLK